MSRTYRKPKFGHNRTKAQYIQTELAWLKLRVELYPDMYNRTRVRKTPEEYQADLKVANDKYELASAELRRYFRGVWNDENHPMHRWYKIRLREIGRAYVSKFKYVYKEFDWEEETKRLAKEYDKRTRDGYCNETGRNFFFKKLNKKFVRLGNKRLERKIIKDDEWDQLPFPHDYEGNKFVWSVW